MTKRYRRVREDCRIDNTVTWNLRVHTISLCFLLYFSLFLRLLICLLDSNWCLCKLMYSRPLEKWVCAFVFDQRWCSCCRTLCLRSAAVASSRPGSSIPAPQGWSSSWSGATCPEQLTNWRRYRKSKRSVGLNKVKSSSAMYKRLCGGILSQ